MANHQGPNDGDSEGACRVFGYYTGYSEGPVRTLECGFLGATTTLQDAELLLRKEHYAYEFYVIEYVDGRHRATRYYDEHKAPKFHTQRVRERRSRDRATGQRRRHTDHSRPIANPASPQPANPSLASTDTLIRADSHE